MRPSIPRTIPAILAFLLLAAHCFRAGWMILVPLCLAAPLLLLVARRGAMITVRALLVAGALEWVRTLTVLALGRRAVGAPWFRMALILGVVAAFTVCSALLLRPRDRSSEHSDQVL